MLRALHYSHYLLDLLVANYPDGNFIDATLGNGNDLLYILNHENFSGHVWGFDIQDQAIEHSSLKIKGHDKADQATICHRSHAELAEVIGDRPIHGAIFNLGYLPGGDHQITTRFESTKEALLQIRSRLVKNGQIIVVVYSGHPQGVVEKEGLQDFLKNWPQEEFQVLQYAFINQRNQPPMVLIIERIHSSSEGTVFD